MLVALCYVGRADTRTRSAFPTTPLLPLHAQVFVKSGLSPTGTYLRRFTRATMKEPKTILPQQRRRWCGRVLAGGVFEPMWYYGSRIEV
jgi:hypothetical protein